jgi:hypothetical protein
MKRVKNIFTEQLSLFGFTKHSVGWYYTNNELVIVINLQKSSYERLYFLNVAVWLNKIKGVCAYPKENICHIRVRAERLFESIPQELNPRKLFDFNESISEEKIESIKLFIYQYLGPALNNLKTIDSLKKLYRESFFKYSYLEKTARNFLSS